MSTVSHSDYQVPVKSILSFSLNTVAVRSLQAAVLGRSSREISQTVRIDCHSFLSCVLISVWPGRFFVGENPKNERKNRGAAIACVYMDCEKNGDTSKHWISTVPASQLASELS